MTLCITVCITDRGWFYRQVDGCTDAGIFIPCRCSSTTTSETHVIATRDSDVDGVDGEHDVHDVRR